MLTAHDLRYLGWIVGIVVVVGVGLGYVVGIATAPDRDRVAVDDGLRPAVEYGAAPAGDAPSAANGIPGYQEVYVNDYADLLDPAAEARIRGDLIELYDRTGIEMTVLTIESRATYGYRGSNEQFATQLFNTWGIGHAERNDGVLILVSEGDREMRIELGAGYARSWDVTMKRVIDDHFLPAFREERYQEGIERGTDETIRAVAGFYPGTYDSGPIRRGWVWIWTALQGAGMGWLSLLVVPLGGFLMSLRRHLRRRPKPCPVCRTRMARMPEETDDTHLDGGQRLEEYLKSVDYDVWRCPACAHLTITRHRSWFSGYGTCPECQYRTLETDTTVLRRATTSSTGLKRLDYACRNCDYTASEERTIPRKSKSSSGSGSSRSSFGGGRSSGGGASGSW